MSLAEIELRESVEPERLPQLMDLYASEWWTAARGVDDVARMLSASDLVFALIDRREDCLVGFARAITDDTYLAVVLDVIVASQWRGSGLGSMLMDAIVGHPRLATVRSLELVCQPGLMAFYCHWGFTDQVGHSRLMRRTGDPVLAVG